MRKLRLYSKVVDPQPVRVLLPYTKPTHKLQTVIDCLRIQLVQPELVRVGDGDEYWTLLRDAWAEGETFFVVEQDVLVWQDAIHEMNACDEQWCTLATMCHGLMFATTFGCVKFSKRLLEQNPGFWDDIPTTWFNLDGKFSDKMGFPYIKPHVHPPAATHLNEVQWNDRISTRYTLERKVVWQAYEEGETVARVKYRMVGDERLPWWHRGRREGTHVAVAHIEDE